MEKILSNPKFGWASVDLGKFKGCVSYLNDIAFEWLEALKVAIENNTIATLYGDEEGSNFYIVLDNYYGFVVEFREETKVIDIDYGIIDFAQELCKAIKTDIKGWANFCEFEDYSEVKLKEKENELLELIADIKESIKNARENND